MGNALKRQTRCYVRSVYADADILLRAGEKALTIGNDALVKVDVAHLPANNPTEDCYSAAKCLASDAYLFGEFHVVFSFSTVKFGCMRFVFSCYGL